MLIRVCNAFKKSFQITLVSCFVFGVFFQKLLKKNHVTRVFLIRYFFIYPQNKDHHSMVSWAWKNFVRRAKITMLSWCFWWKNSQNMLKKSCRYCIFAHFFLILLLKKDNWGSLSDWVWISEWGWVSKFECEWASVTG